MKVLTTKNNITCLQPKTNITNISLFKDKEMQISFFNK